MRESQGTIFEAKNIFHTVSPHTRYVIYGDIVDVLRSLNVDNETYVIYVV